MSTRTASVIGARTTRALTVALAVVVLLVGLPAGAGAQIESQIPALIDFSDAWTNDDGTVDGADAGDIGDVSGIYDAWGTSSSDDPAGFGLGAPRYDKDVARCTADLDELNNPDEVNILIENAYPSYHCTFVATIENSSNFPATVEMITIDVDENLTLVEQTNIELGTIIGAGASIDVVYTVHVEQPAPQGEDLFFWITYKVGGDTIDLELDVECIEGQDQFTFRYILMNKGPDDATGVKVSTTLPNLPFVSSNPGAPTYIPNTWTVGALGAGTGKTLDVVMSSDGSTPPTASGQVTAADQIDVDSIPANNVLSEDDQDDASCSLVQDTTATSNVSSSTTGESLPKTGSSIDRLTAIGTSFLFLGAMLLITSTPILRRRRQRT